MHDPTSPVGGNPGALHFTPQLRCPAGDRRVVTRCVAERFGEYVALLDPQHPRPLSDEYQHVQPVSVAPRGLQGSLLVPRVRRPGKVFGSPRHAPGKFPVQWQLLGGGSECFGQQLHAVALRVGHLALKLRELL